MQQKKTAKKTRTRKVADKDAANKEHHQNHIQDLKICVSGSAVNICGPKAAALAKEVGREIARQGAVLFNGATTGMPYNAALGAKQEGGIVIGFSPALSRKDHIDRYKLPTKNHDMIMYTGLDWSGRNLILVRSSDAVISICGRIGTLNEFTNAFEDDKVIGVMVGSGGTSQLIDDVIEMARRGRGTVIYDSDPVKLVKRVVAAVKRRKGHQPRVYDIQEKRSDYVEAPPAVRKKKK